MKARTTTPRSRLLVNSPPCCFLAGIRDAERGIVLTEILVAGAVLSLLLGVVLPALAHDRVHSTRILCVNNLRQLGVGFQIWGNDHNDTLPQETAVSDGGTMRHSLAANVWLHLAWISNEVSSPRIYFCPSDTGQAATEFTLSPEVGYLHSNLRNAASSYFLGYTGLYSLNRPDRVVAGDRNVATAGPAGCSRFNTALIVLRPLPADVARWTDGLHGPAGNVLTYDGQVLQLDRGGLNRVFAPVDDNGNKHIIVPR